MAYVHADWKKPPNLISLFRGLVALLLAYYGISTGLRLAFGWSVPQLQLPWFQILIVLGIVSDKVDGVLARRYAWTSDLGKILERNVDGSFIFSAVLFETLYLGLPTYLWLEGFLVLSIALLVVLATRFVYKVWFIDNYVSTKFLPGYAYLMLILHAFAFPLVVWFDYVAAVLGIFTLADFLFRWMRWKRELPA